MPRVMICSVITGRETSLRSEIFDILRDTKFASDVVVTIEREATLTTDADDAKKPFLLVFDNDGVRGDAIAALLSKNLSMDVELVSLYSFHPAPAPPKKDD